MGDIIQFPNRDKPDAVFKYTDDDGMEWFLFTCTYIDRESKQMSFTFWALSLEDAQDRLSLIKDNAKVDGQVYAAWWKE